MCPGAEDEIPAAQTGQFRCPQARLQGDQQQDVVSPTGPGRTVGRSQQCCDLRSIKERDASFHIALVRQSEDSLAVQQPLRLVHGDIPEEGADGGKPRIAASRAIASSHFNMDEQVADHFGFNVGEDRKNTRLNPSHSCAARMTYTAYRTYHKHADKIKP